MSSKTAPDPTPRRWSLAGRLTRWYTASSFLLLAASTGFLYLTLTSKLEAEDDQFLAEKVELVRMLLRDHTGPPRVLPGPGDNARGAAAVFLRVIGADGRALLTTAGMDEALPDTLFPPPSAGAAIAGDERWLPDGRCFRLAAVRTADPDRLIQVAMDRTQEEALLAAYRWNLAAVLLAALAGSAALGYRIARHGLRPVAAITATAAQVGSSTLDERIDARGLPAELETLAATFNAMLDRLEGAFARLRQFSADLAHELRTPVNNLRGEIEVTLGKPRSTDEYRDTLGSSLEECGRLAEMIDNLLFLARAENPRTAIARDPLELTAELATVCEFYEAAATDAGVRLVVGVGPPVAARLNRPLLQRAVSNLVANALAHTPAGGAVMLRAVGERGGARIEVADTGHGIPAEHLPHVFERFYRADEARSSPGFGLGLAIVRSIVELHGGTVAVRSDPGRGTVVTMTFPAAPSGE
ncbi:MAG: heavy metal sensor histidine kinase [Gemmataceae bacterium]